MYIYIVFNIIMFSSPRSKAGVYFYKPRRNIFLAASLYGTEMDGAKQRTVPPPATQGKSICGQKERVGKKAAVRELERMLRFGMREGMKVGMGGWLLHSWS